VIHIFTITSHNTLNQVTPIYSIVQILPLMLSIFAAIIAVVIPLYLYKQLNQKISSYSEYGEKIKKLEENLSNLTSKFDEVSTKIKDIKTDKLEEVTRLSEKISSIERKIEKVESEIDNLKKPMVPFQLEEIKETEIDSLQELQIYYPFIKYASIMSSQGFTIEIVGKGIDEPAKLLEIIKISDMFAGSKEIIIEKKEDLLYLFYLDTLEDLDIYGIVLAKKPLNTNSLSVIKNVLHKYFSKKKVVE